jgi:hypothetical protein
MAENKIDVFLLGETRIEGYFKHGFEDDNRHQFNQIQPFQTKPSRKGGVVSLHSPSDFNK